MLLAFAATDTFAASKIQLTLLVNCTRFPSVRIDHSYREHAPQAFNTQGSASASIGTPTSTTSSVRIRNLYSHPQEYSGPQRLTVERCYRKDSAWVGDQQTGRLAYVLPSLLHEWYLSLLLFAPAQKLPVQLGICTPLDLLKQAVQKFQPLQLQAPVTIGPSCEPQPNEAIFQDEFYHACHTVTKGKLLATPCWRV